MFHRLPIDILFRLVDFLHSDEVVVLCQVERYLKRVIDTRSFWLHRLFEGMSRTEIKKMALKEDHPIVVNLTLRHEKIFTPIRITTRRVDQVKAILLACYIFNHPWRSASLHYVFQDVSYVDSRMIIQWEKEVLEHVSLDDTTKPYLLTAIAYYSLDEKTYQRIQYPPLYLDSSLPEELIATLGRFGLTCMIERS